MLILAGVTVATLFGDNGIIKKAQKAKDETEKSTKNELGALNSLEGEMENAIKGNTSQEDGWRQPDPLKPEITNGDITLKIGDYVDYSCKSSTATYTSPASKSGHTQEQVFKANEYQYGWRVLGVDKNTKQLQLISEDFVPLTGGGDRGNRTGQYYYLKGQSGYINGVEELNKICAIYGTGNSATSARTVNVEDINWITGYNPNNIGVKDQNKTGSGTKCYTGEMYEYGNTVEYELVTTGVKSTSKGNNAIGGLDKTNEPFTYLDLESNTWKNLVINVGVTVRNDLYRYYPTTLTLGNNQNATIGIANTSDEYKMLFTNSSTGSDTANAGETENICYWLGASCVNTGYGSFGQILYGVRNINAGCVDYSPLYSSKTTTYSKYYGVRPVVSLDSKVKLRDSGTNKDGCKLYNIIQKVGSILN